MDHNMVIYSLVEHKKSNRALDVPVSNFNTKARTIEPVVNQRGYAYALRSSHKNKRHHQKHKMKKQLRQAP